MKKFCPYGNGTVFDIGANIGYHTLAFALATNKGGKVYAWEPHPSNYMLLEKNVNQNNLGHVTLFNNAVGDDIFTVCFVPIIDTPERRDSHGVMAFSNNGDLRPPDKPKDRNCEVSKGEVGVSTMTVDSVNVDRLDFIKIDVQGFEKKVLISGLTSILKYKPAIIIEFEEDQMRRLGYVSINCLLLLYYSFIILFLRFIYRN